MSEHRCVVCPQLRQGEPRIYERANVCDGHRAALRGMLAEVDELYAKLDDELAPGQSNGQRVSGSREAPLPLRVDPLDLTMPARAGAVVDDLIRQYDVFETTVDHVYLIRTPDGPRYARHGVRVWRRRPAVDRDLRPVLIPARDQVGHLSVASVLDAWVRDWRDALCPAEGLPAPTVSTLVAWLTHRLGPACDTHPAVDEFAAELRDLLHTLRRVVGVAEVKPEHLDAPCRRCDLLDLHRLPGEDRVECGSCGDLLTEDEYRRWCGLLAAGAA